MVLVDSLVLAMPAFTRYPFVLNGERCIPGIHGTALPASDWAKFHDHEQSNTLVHADAPVSKANHLSTM